MCLTPGQASECRWFVPLIQKVCGLKEDGTLTTTPGAVAGDKGYSSNANREWLRSHEIKVVIPTKANETKDPDFDQELYRGRNIVERVIGWLKEKRRLSSRYEKLAVHYLAMIQIYAILTLL